MKTAEEIAKEIYRCSQGEVVTAIIKSAQLDAFKAGMTKAIHLLRKEVSTCHCSTDDCQPCVARNNSIIDIERVRDNTTKL